MSVGSRKRLSILLLSYNLIPGIACLELLAVGAPRLAGLDVDTDRGVGQCPLYYSHKPTGRGDDYSDMSGKALFPFGHGLSYTTFEYANLKIEPASIPVGRSVTVKVDVTNSGDRKGDEVVQLYIHDPIASVVRPVQELKGFSRVSLAAGEKKTIAFTLGRNELSFLNKDLKPVVEPGEIQVMVGSSSVDIRARANFQIERP